MDARPSSGATACSRARARPLTVLAAALGARSAVEVGTGTGVASLSLLRGMLPDGVLTTIDVEVEHQRAAKAAFAEAGIRATRARAISGRALDVLPRLTDGAYDLVLVSAAETSCALYVEQARRLLREGGMLVVDNAPLGRQRGRPRPTGRGHHGDPRRGPSGPGRRAHALDAAARRRRAARLREGGRREPDLRQPRSGTALV